jgi:hypothetical protein
VTSKKRRTGIGDSIGVRAVGFSVPPRLALPTRSGTAFVTHPVEF